MRLALCWDTGVRAGRAASACTVPATNIGLVSPQLDRPAGRGTEDRGPRRSRRLPSSTACPWPQPRGLRLDGTLRRDAAAGVCRCCRCRPGGDRRRRLRADPAGLAAGAAAPRLSQHPCLAAAALARAAPIQRAIEAGDAETGVTLMQMDAGLDTGADPAGAMRRRSPPTTPARRLRHAWRLSAATLRARPGRRGRRPAAPRSNPTPGVTYAAKIAKAEATIDWREPAASIERRLRAFDPFPGARSLLDGEAITCWRGAGPVPAGPAAPGQIVAVERR